MANEAVVSSASVRGPATGLLRPATLGWRRRVGLLAGTVAAAVTVYSVAMPHSPAAEIEPELRRLIRAMILLKGATAVTVVLLIGWRFGLETPAATAVRYTMAATLLIVSVVWLWSLLSLLVAAFAFYASLVSCAIAVRLDEPLHDHMRRQVRFSRVETK